MHLLPLRAAGLLVIMTLWLSGCTTTKQIAITQVAPSALAITGEATAGAVSVDITPPPGMPMGGYSMMANNGIGFRTRLKARIIYINDGQGQATALVQTDLTAGSLLLHHKVAAAVATITGLKASDIVITASHSHSTPVNHFENDFYNKHMSNQAGLDEQYLSFISQQISTGIERAFRQRKAAKIATGRRDIYGYNRNRALDAYLRNATVNSTNIDIDPADPQAVFTAVNPALYMIRVDVKDSNNQFKPLAAFSSFSVHATALSPAVEVYNADLFAYAQKDLQWQVQQEYATSWPVVHALTTGTQGDMAPALPDTGDNYFSHAEVNWPLAKRLGQGIGQEALTLFHSLETQLTTDVKITTAARELNIQSSNRIDDTTLCQQPAVGAPVAGGAYERRTPYLSAIPFFKGGNIMARSWFFTEGCQGNKTHLGFKYIQPLLEPVSSFPNTVLFQLVSINDAVIIPLPFEVTTEAGRRIADNVSREYAASNKPMKYVWVASNANGYFGYATTPEEYTHQGYEGGHTLYGQYSTPYLSAQLSALARDLQHQNVNESLPEWQYSVIVNLLTPTRLSSQGQRKILTQPTLQQPTNAVVRPAKIEREDASNSGQTIGAENYIRFQWLDVNPSEIAFHQPLIKVETQQQGQWQTLKQGLVPITDEGYDIEIRYLAGAANNMGEYEVRWYNPIPGQNYRFRVAPRQTQSSLYSAPFTVMP